MTPATSPSDKPSYLGLLNAIALAESRAHAYLTAWMAVTPNPDVRTVLATVAAREGEHGMAFAKRINELGYSVLERADPSQKKKMGMAKSDRTDREKMEAIGLNELDTGDQPDIFDRFFTDHSIDIQTGALLGRYICEERDSGRLLRSCYEQLKAPERPKAPAKASKAKASKAKASKARRPERVAV
jgi:hypothetical protein